MSSGRFIKLPVEALLDDRLSDRERRVLMALYSFGSNPGDQVWPSRESISKLARCQPPHVSTAITRLVSLGWVERKQGSQGPNHYTLLCPTVTDSVTVTNSVTTSTVTDSVIHSYRFGNSTVTDSVTHITDQEQTIEQTNSTAPARERVMDDKQPGGTSSGGDGPRKGEPKQARKLAHGLSADWWPSDNCWSLIDQHGITRAFAELQIGEFRLYWRGEGKQRKSWDATFLNRVKDQWKREQSHVRTSHGKHREFDNSAVARTQRACEQWRREQELGADQSGVVLEGDFRRSAF